MGTMDFTDGDAFLSVENFKQTKSQAELQVDKQNYYFFIFQKH